VSAVYQRGLGIFLTETPPPDTPQHLFHALFPALRSDPLALSGASHRKQSPSSNFIPLLSLIRLCIQRCSARTHKTMKLVPSLSSTCLTALLAFPALAAGAVVQTNSGTGDGSLPGLGAIVAANNLLYTSLASASRTGAGVTNPGDLYFYDEGSIPVVLGRLYDGQFGGKDSIIDAVLPNEVSLTFNLELGASPTGYNLTRILTYAYWDASRDGQQYTVEYSTASAPGSWMPLASANRFDNTNFPIMREQEIYDEDGNGTGTYELVPDYNQSATRVELQSDSGLLAENVGALRFNFTGIESGGTAYREFVVEGASIPEPTTAFATLGFLASRLLIRRRTSRPN
jgi:hypothetical protein